MFRNSLAVAGVLGLLTGSASAGVTFYSFGSGAPSATLVTNFSGDTVGNQPTTAATGFSWVSGGTAAILDTTSGLGAEPAIANGVYGTGNYLSVEGGTTETLDVSAPDITKIYVYIGSLDPGNSIFFAGPNVTYNGVEMGAVSGADNGAQTTGNTNGVFEFSFSSPITSVTFTTPQNSFEIASISAGTPEPAAWALMLVGIGGVGAAIRLRRRQIAATA
jgi:hypothetical protein